MQEGGVLGLWLTWISALNAKNGYGKGLSGFFHVMWSLKTRNNAQTEGNELLDVACCLLKRAIKDPLSQHMVELKAYNCDHRFEAHAISLGNTFNFVMKVISWIDAS